MRGKIRDIIPAGRTSVLSLDLSVPASELDKYMGKELSVALKPFSPARTLSQNDYFHVLVGKMASVLRVTANEVKNQMISDYGQINRLEDGSLDWSVKPPTFNWLKSVNHYQPTDRYVLNKGQKCPVYIVMRGSHTYNTQEMSVLIDGTISEAKELGIETATPDELARMREHDRQIEARKIKQKQGQAV